MNDIEILASICILLALWVLRLTRKLARAEEFSHMAMLALRDVADNKVQITRDGEGTITIKKLKGESK